MQPTLHVHCSDTVCALQIDLGCTVARVLLVHPVLGQIWVFITLAWMKQNQWNFTDFLLRPIAFAQINPQISKTRVRNYWLSRTPKNTVGKLFFLYGFPTRNPVKINALESQNLRKAFRVFLESQKEQRKANFQRWLSERKPINFL